MGCLELVDEWESCKKHDQKIVQLRMMHLGCLGLGRLFQGKSPRSQLCHDSLCSSVKQTTFWFDTCMKFLVKVVLMLAWNLCWKSRLSRRLDLLLHRWLCWFRWCLLVLIWNEGKARWKVSRKLTRFNPVKLEFRKAVRFSSNELIDVTVVKQFPQVLLFQS